MAQVLKEEVRNRILEAAEKVFYKKDYRGAKLTEIAKEADIPVALIYTCLLYTSPSPRDRTRSRMPSSA